MLCHNIKSKFSFFFRNAPVDVESPGDSANVLTTHPADFDMMFYNYLLWHDMILTCLLEIGPRLSGFTAKMGEMEWNFKRKLPV